MQGGKVKAVRRRPAWSASSEGANKGRIERLQRLQRGLERLQAWL